MEIESLDDFFCVTNIPRKLAVTHLGFFYFCSLLLNFVFNANHFIEFDIIFQTLRIGSQHSCRGNHCIPDESLIEMLSILTVVFLFYFFC